MLNHKKILILILLILCFLLIGLNIFPASGVDWYAATQNAAFTGRLRHGSVIFDNKMWIIAGAQTTYHFSDVWWSTNGSDWYCATTNAAFGVREGFICLVYDDKMWVIAGNSNGTRLKDVWWSSNGVDWYCATGNAGFPIRNNTHGVVYDDGSGEKNVGNRRI